MSGIVLSAVDLSSTVNIDNGKGDGIAIITETTTHTPNCTSNHIENVAAICENSKIHSTSMTNQTIESNENNFDVCSTNRQRSITTNSIGSNNISIVTLDENENDSSVIDSDSDIDEVNNTNDSYNEYRNSSGIVLVNQNIDPPNLCQSSILCTNNDVKPNIGSIAVQNSSDITFGNKTFYQGPVTIKQFVYDKNKWRETDTNENDNHGYVNNSTDNISKHEKGKSLTSHFFQIRIKSM